MNNVFQPGFGQQLKAAREAQSLTVADVAAKLKLTTRQIENLETENFAQLPGEVFVRGFIRNYARLVGMDAEHLLLPVEAAQTVAETITAPSEGLTFARPGVKRWILLPAISGLLFLVLVAILYHWLREGEEALVVEPVAVQPMTVQPLTVEPQALPTTDPAAPGAPGTDPASSDPTAAQGGAPGVAPGAAASVTPAPTPAPPAAPATVPPANKPAVPAPVTPPPAAVPASKPATVPPPPPPKPVIKNEPATSNLRFSAQADAWIQVSDGKGKRFSRLVKAGTAEVFAGVPPYTLVVGEAAQVKLSYKGQNVDLAPFIGEKVARLTLE